MHRKLQRMALVLTLLSVGVWFVSDAPLAHAATTPNVGSYSPFYHIFGGFTIITSDKATTAASDGVNQAQIYGLPADPSSALGQTLQSLRMHEVDSYLWALLYEYECHRSHVVPHTGASCKEDYPFMTSVSVLLSLVQSHLQQVAGNALVNAYWVLDDWPAWDYGSARTILQQIRALIHRYTPNRPAICGFGTEIDARNVDYWTDSLADNFSPQGCDMVGLYIYSAYEPPPYKPSDVFDWSMSTVLSKIFTSLGQRGWNIIREPMIGIGQAFAGTYPGTQYQVVTPSAQNMATQALSFCEHGASAVFFYGWDLGTDLSNPQTPMNNSIIEGGVRQAIAACKSYWRGH